MSIQYDDPYNLKEPDQFRASLGILLEIYDSTIIDSMI